MNTDTLTSTILRRAGFYPFAELRFLSSNSDQKVFPARARSRNKSFFWQTGLNGECPVGAADPSRAVGLDLGGGTRAIVRFTARISPRVGKRVKGSVELRFHTEVSKPAARNSVKQRESA